MPSLTRILLPVALLAQFGLVRLAAGREHPPSLPGPSMFSAGFGEWIPVREDPIDEEIRGKLGADRLLSKTYIQGSTGRLASLFVAWFQSQTGGVSQPHSPQVCLPGSGWTPVAVGKMAVDTSADSIEVNRYAVTNHDEHAVVLYWYQSPRRVVAGEWAAKLWTVVDAIRDRRTDTSLVRVIVWSVPGLEQEATKTAASLASAVYPVLRAEMPR